MDYHSDKLNVLMWIHTFFTLGRTIKIIDTLNIIFHNKIMLSVEVHVREKGPEAF